MALSSDGSMLAFVSPDENTGLSMIYVQRIGSSAVTLLPGTQNASFPFWSPDGASVAFFAGGKLQKVALGGGTPQVLATVLAARGGSWGSQNVIIYAPDTASGLWRVNADGSGIAPVTYLSPGDKAQQTHRWPLFLPDGKRFLYWAGNFANQKDDHSNAIYLGSLDSKEQVRIVPCHSSFAYDSSNIYYADDNRQLVSTGFDTSTAKISGNLQPVANQVGFQPSTYWAAVTASINGTLIYNTGVGAVSSVLTWMDRSGKELSRIGDPGILANPSISPDGSRIAVDVTDLKANNVDIWLMSTIGANSARFTFDPAEEVAAVWSRDGNALAYRSVASKGSTLVIKRANGLEPEKTIVTATAIDDFIPDSWSFDNQQILFTDQSTSRSYLALASVAGGTPTPLLNTKANETNGQISPYGKWVAYASDESGAWEVYVTSFPGAAGKWQVSRGGGTEPRWRGDGKEIFYIAPNGILTAVSVDGEGTFATGTPAPLFQIRGRAQISSTDAFTYDVAKDGKRFLVNRYVKPEHVPPLTIVLNVQNGNPAP
jgi:Tol biopolymer transport system component